MLGWFHIPTTEVSHRIRDAVEGEVDALVQSAVMGTKFDPFSQVGVMVGSDIAFYYGMNSGSNQAELFNASNNKAGVDSQASENETGLHRPIKLGVSDFTSTKLESEGVLSAEASSAPDQQALYATKAKAKALGLSTDISESQWIQSAMGYNRDTTAFNYTQNATSIPSMQLDYSRFMDSVMTATQPTIKYPAYAASNPSSVQPTAQGVGTKSGGFLGSIENGLKKVGNYWHQMQDAYSQFAKANPYAADQLALSNPLAFALSGKAQAGVQNAGDIGVAFIDGGVRTVLATIVGVGKATAGVFTDPVGTYHKVDAWGNRLEAGVNYLGDHPFKSAYALYQLASAHLEKLSTQTAIQNARELGGLVAGSAITAGIGKIAGSGLSFLVDIGSDAQKLVEFSQVGKYSVQYRTERMLAKDVGYNISPEMWFNEFDALGISGTYVTDYRAIGEVLGPVRANQKFDVGFFSGKNRISYFKARKLEGALGLNPKTLSGGFRFTRVTNLFERAPRSPITGNEYFLGAGNGLPGGGPELVVDSLPVEPWPPIRSQP